MKIVREIIQIDEELCDGCGKCIAHCDEGALQLREGKIHLIAEKICNGSGNCTAPCPNGALTIVTREAEEFDEDAMDVYFTAHAEELAIKEPVAKTIPVGPQPCGCGSTQLQGFPSHGSCHGTKK